MGKWKHQTRQDVDTSSFFLYVRKLYFAGELHQCILKLVLASQVERKCTSVTVILVPDVYCLQWWSISACDDSGLELPITCNIMLNPD